MAYTIESLPGGGVKQPRYTIESLPEEPSALDQFQRFTQGFADFTNKMAIPAVTAGMGGPLVQGAGIAAKAAMGALEGYGGEKLNQLLGLTQESPTQTTLGAGLGAAGGALPGVVRGVLTSPPVRWAARKLPGAAEVIGEGAAQQGDELLKALAPPQSKAQLMEEAGKLNPTIPLGEYTPQSVAMSREVGGQLPTTVQRSQALTQESEQLLTSLQPKTSSDQLYALVNQFNPKLPTEQYKKVAHEILEEQDKGALLTPGVASGKLRELASRILANQEATPARQVASSILDPAGQAIMKTVPGKPAPVATFQEARASLKILRNAAKDMTTPEQAGYVHLRSTLLQDMEEAAKQGAAGPARDALRAANATARKEFALEDVADILQGKASQKLVQGKLEIGGVSPLKNWQDKLRTDELFRNSFPPHELQAIDQYVTKVAGADKAPLRAPYASVSGSMQALDDAIGMTGDPVRLAQLKQFRGALERDVARTGQAGVPGAPGLIYKAEVAGKREGAIGDVRGMLERGTHTKKGFNTPLLQGEAPLKAWTSKLQEDPSFARNFTPDEQAQVVGYLTQVAKNPAFGVGGEANYLGRAVGGVIGGGVGQLGGLGPAGATAGMVLGMGLPEAVARIMRSSVGRHMLGAAAKSGKKPTTETLLHILQLVRASTASSPEEGE